MTEALVKAIVRVHRDVIDDYEDYLLQQNRSLSTVRTYVSRINQFNNSNYAVATEWLNSLDPEQPNTIKISLAAMKSFYTFMAWDTDSLIKYKAPAAKPPQPRPIPGGMVVIHDVIGRVIREPGLYHEKSASLIALGAYAGLRVSESISANPDDVNLDTRMLLVHGKGMRYREVPFSDRLEAALSFDHMDRRGFAPVSNSYARSLIQRTFKQADITHKDGTAIASHDLRATFATEVYEKTGHDILVVQKLLGHANVSQTQSYIGVNTTKLHNAVSF